MTPFRYLDRHSADLVALLQKLVRIPTVNPPGENYGAITALLTRELSAAGLSARRLAIPRAAARCLAPGLRSHPRYNVLGSTTPALPRHFILTRTTTWCLPGAAGGTRVRSPPPSRTAGSMAAALRT